MWTTIAKLKSNITAIATDVLDTKDELESGDYIDYEGDEGVGLESPQPSNAQFMPSPSRSTSNNYSGVDSPREPTPSWIPLQNSGPSPLPPNHNAEV